MFICERIETIHDNNEEINEVKVRLISLDFLLEDDFDWADLKYADESEYQVIQ